MAAETDTLDLRYETKYSANIAVSELEAELASILQHTNREGLHTAHVLQMALHENGQSGSSAKNYPEKKYVDGMKLNQRLLQLNGV